VESNESAEREESVESAEREESVESAESDDRRGIDRWGETR
jgi:hypothetical protein